MPYYLQRCNNETTSRSFKTFSIFFFFTKNVRKLFKKCIMSKNVNSAQIFEQYTTLRVQQDTRYLTFFFLLRYFWYIRVCNRSLYGRTCATVTEKLKRKKQNDGRKGRTEEIYANDLEQDYKMASLIPVTVLNFALGSFCPLALVPSRLLFSFSSSPFAASLALSVSAPVTLTYSSLLTESKRTSSSFSKELSPGMILEFFCATVSMNAAFATQ